MLIALGKLLKKKSKEYIIRTVSAIAWRGMPFEGVVFNWISMISQRGFEDNLPELIAGLAFGSATVECILEEKVYSIPHNRNIESLNVDSVESVASIPLEVVRAVIDQSGQIV